MGLITAAVNAVTGTISSQWKEYFYCDAMPDSVLATKAMKKTKGVFGFKVEDENVISQGSVVAVADGQCMMIDDLALIDDHHALAVVHGNDGAVGNHIVKLHLGAAESLGNALLRLGNQNIGRKRLGIEIITPLIRENACEGAISSFQKSHNNILSVLKSTIRQKEPPPRAREPPELLLEELCVSIFRRVTVS